MADLNVSPFRKGILVAVYWVLVLLPVLVLLLTGNMANMVIFHAAARFFAVTAFAMLLLQPVLSARFHWIENALGLDRILLFHRKTGVTAAVFAVLHPVMLGLGSKSFALLTNLNSPRQIAAGKITILLLVLYGVAAVYRRALKIPFQFWLRMHNGLAPVIIAGAFLHSWFTAVRYMPVSMRVLWFFLLSLSLFSYLHLTLYQRVKARMNPFIVSGVNRITPDVWEIVMTPGKGGKLFSYLPGQFLFLTLLRGRGLPREEHPFTISSSPSEKGNVSVTVKESGDFTASAGQTRPGDRAAVLAPYGRFSFLLHPERGRTVFIAGGIGVTPILSMLRFMAHGTMERDVFLFYANRTEPDIAFRNELEEMTEAGSQPELNLVHILSSPGEEWTGERGRLNGEILKKHLNGFSNTSFYLCGPPPMMESLETDILRQGVNPRNIHTEKFSL